MLVAAGVPLALLPALVGRGLWPLWLGSAWRGARLLLAARRALALPRARGLTLEANAADTPLHRRARRRSRCALERAARARAPRRRRGRCATSTTTSTPQPTSGSALRARRRAAERARCRSCRAGAASRRRRRASWLRWTRPARPAARRRSRGRSASASPSCPTCAACAQAALRFFSAREFLAGLKVAALRRRRHGVRVAARVRARPRPARDRLEGARRGTASCCCREFRAERNHQVVLAVDTGHLMREPLAGIPRLDHAINAALLLAYVRSRPATGSACSPSTRACAAVRPSRAAASARLRRGCSSSRPSSTTRAAETNFTLGLAELDAAPQRRSLVVVLTDFVDTVTAELMIENLGAPGAPPPGLFVTLRDPALDAGWRTARPRDLGDAEPRGGRARDLAARARGGAAAAARGWASHCIDAAAGAALGTRLINRYLDIKRRELVVMSAASRRRVPPRARGALGRARALVARVRAGGPAARCRRPS